MDSYKLALLFLRCMGAMYLTVGVAWLAAVVIVMFGIGAFPNSGETARTIGTALMGLLPYALLDLVAGPSLLVFSKPLARLAAKHVGPNLNSN